MVLTWIIQFAEWSSLVIRDMDYYMDVFGQAPDRNRVNKGFHTLGLKSNNAAFTSGMDVVESKQNTPCRM